MKFPTFISLCLSLLVFSCAFEKKSLEEPYPLGWELMETPTQASLRGLSPLTSEIIWASGSQGTWLRTLDGGKSWDHGIIDGLDSVDFRDIEAFDAASAVAISAGQPAVIYRTENGGKDWKKVFQGEEEDFFDGMVFYKERGYVIGDEVGGKWKVLLSRDFGKSWEVLASSPMAAPESGSFAASGSTILAHGDHIWFASGGLSSSVFHSADRGMHWTEIPTPILQGESSQGIFSLTRVDQNILFGVGGDFLQPDLAYNNAIISTQLGDAWTLATGNFPSGYRSGVTYFPLQHWLIAVGPNGSDFSKNTGMDWEKFSNESLHAVFVDQAQSSVWASGPEGKIARLLY